MLNNILFFENRAVYEKIWKNIVERGRLQMTIWRMRIACWIPKATETHSQYVIFITFTNARHYCVILTLPVFFCFFRIIRIIVRRPLLP